MSLAGIAAGIVLLLFGRKIFWLFVGIMGFIYGLNIAMLVFPGYPTWVFFTAALCTGIIGALVAVFLQRVMAGLAGFLAGAYLVFSSLNFFAIDMGQFTWIACSIVGILCGVICFLLFDWALIILSSLVGALLIVQSMDTGVRITASVFAVSSIAGIAIQRSLLYKTVKKPTKKA